MIFILIALMFGGWVPAVFAVPVVGGRVPHPYHHPAGLHLHDAHHRLSDMAHAEHH
jgi:hypothetical protein